jgi:hypothetical protein
VSKRYAWPSRCAESGFRITRPPGIHSPPGERLASDLRQERLQARCFRLEPGIPVLRLGERSGTVILLVTSTLGNCSCVAPPPASMQSSATAPALRSTRMCKCRGRRMRWSDLSTACSRRGSTASIHGVVPPASMQSSATAPALRSTWMCKCRGCRMRWSDPRRLFQTPFYLPRPWGRTSCIHAVVGNCSCVALPPASMQSSFVARHPCRGITRLPASECLSLAWPLRRRSGANSAAGPQGEGQEPEVRERHQREGHPKAEVSGLLPSDSAPGLRGFADSTSVCWQQTGRDPSRPPYGPFLRPAATAYGTLVARIVRAKA